MQKFESVDKNIRKNVLRRFIAHTVLFVKSRFYKLDIPVAIIVPDKIVKLCRRNAKLKFFKICRNLFYKSVIFIQNPFIFNAKIFKARKCNFINADIHQQKS